MQTPATTITTARLVLRPFGLADAAGPFSIRGDEQAMRFWDWPQDETIEQTCEIARLLVAEAHAGEALYWAARTPEGAFVGLFDLGAFQGTSAELGFMVAPPHWRKGYASEAARALGEDAAATPADHTNPRGKRRAPEGSWPHSASRRAGPTERSLSRLAGWSCARASASI